ncbi:DNA mismatch repair proteins mutS family domain-containing protein [Entamoeba marina]
MKRSRYYSTTSDSPILFAICESKGKEIGVCWFDSGSNQVGFSQYLDTNTYIQTLILLNIHNPTQVIISKTQEMSELSQLIKNQNRKVVFVQRSSFNENDGVVLSEKLFSIDCVDLLKKKICHKALMHQIDKTSFIIQPGTLYGKYVPLSNKVTIDVQTAFQLELFLNISDEKKNGSLLWVLDQTLTPNGRKELINNILQPPSDIPTIVERQNAVEYFLCNSNHYYRCIDFLKRFPDVGHIITSIVQLSRQESLHTSTISTILKNIAELYKLVQFLPQFEKLLESFESPPLIFVAMKKLVKENGFEVIRNALNNVIDESVTYSKQKTLQEITRIGEKLMDDGLFIKSSVSGFYLIWKGDRESIPEGCCRIVKITEDKYSVNTPELLSLNSKYIDSRNEITKLSIGILAEKVEELKIGIGSLNRITEMVGLLDMILSFVTYTISNKTMCRPIFNENRSIIIKQGKHPILQKTLQNFVANDTFIDDASRFCLINGPNMGGKSTYIRQIALLMILAHMGCYIPAEAASIRPLSNILSRLSTDDAMESKQSSFLKEMKETKEILNCMTDNSLILIDELGRGTGIIDGVSLAWSVSEQIILKSLSTCLFVSHFPELSKMEKLYPHVVREYHMDVQLNDRALCPRYILTEGYCNVDYYGIRIAEMAGFPQEIIEKAFDLKRKIQGNQPQKLNTSKYDLSQKLISLKNSKLKEGDIRAYLQYLRNQYVEE